MTRGAERKFDAARFRIAVFSLGTAACIAQVLLTRELFVAFLGNELTIGLALATWLIGIAGGALVARRAAGRIAGRRIAATAAAAMAAFGSALPLLFHVSRIIRSVAGVPVGEVGSLGQVLLGSTAVCVPCGLAIGFVFPLLCAAQVAEGGSSSGAPGSLYGWESFGSMLAGVLLSWWLLPRAGGLLVAVGGGLIGVVGAGFAVSRRLGVVGLSAVLTLAALESGTGLVGRMETASVEARWRRSGLLGSGTRLVSSRDTVYQNLAVLEQAGQNALYANGQVSLVFPDPLAAEHENHAVMAQKPDARRVLLVGSATSDDLRVLLRHPIVRLVHVDLDPLVRATVREAEGISGIAAVSDDRLVRVSADGVRYVMQTGERFDFVLVRAPQPGTLAAGRYYTAEFYRQVRRIMDPGGVLACSVELSERLEKTAALLGASVDRTLRSVFPLVLNTAGARILFLAGDAGSGLTLDRAELVRRSRGEGFGGVYFKPEFFLGVDDYDPDKIAQVRARLDGSDARINVLARPVSTLYTLLLWRQVSGTSGWFAGQVAVGSAALVLVLLCVAALRGRTVREGRRARVSVLVAALVTTGMVSMAAELVLILVLQSLCGYVYTRMAMVFGAFMLGLALGALSVRRLLASPDRTARALLAMEVALAGLAVCPLLLLSGAPALSVDLGGVTIAEAVVYVVVLLVGAATGAEFPLGVCLLSAADRNPCSVAVADAADHAGAALGALLTSAILVPCLGIASSVWLLGGIKLASAGALAVVCLRRAGCSSAEVTLQAND